MRGRVRSTRREDEEESVFVSMTDMTVSFLFIIMLLLAFFASQYNEQDTVPRTIHNDVIKERDIANTEVQRLLLLITKHESTIDELREKIQSLEDIIAKLKKLDPLETYLQMSAVERRRILESLRDQLKVDFPDMEILISAEADALRFQGDGLFATGSSELRADRKKIISSIANRLEAILPCYTLGVNSNWNPDCNPSSAVIEALQIEGHTDSTGTDINNLMLSTARANTTFITMINSQPQLIKYLNVRQQPVLSVAGYGAMRPVADNNTESGKSTNRRVDLRIIMYTPTQFAEIERIKLALAGEIKHE